MSQLKIITSKTHMPLDFSLHTFKLCYMGAVREWYTEKLWHNQLSLSANTEIIIPETCISWPRRVLKTWKRDLESKHIWHLNFLACLPLSLSKERPIRLVELWYWKEEFELFCVNKTFLQQPFGIFARKHAQIWILISVVFDRCQFTPNMIFDFKLYLNYAFHKCEW